MATVADDKLLSCALGVVGYCRNLLQGVTELWTNDKRKIKLFDRNCGLIYSNIVCQRIE